jgi:hypothetical protein
MSSGRQFKLPDTLELWMHVSVAWEDIVAHFGGRNSADFKEVKPCIRRTAGYVLRYDDKYLVIAATDDRDSQQDTDCEDVTIIPTTNVRRIIRK